jgi:hypothetical protein
MCAIVKFAGMLVEKTPTWRSVVSKNVEVISMSLVRTDFSRYANGLPVFDFWLADRGRLAERPALDTWFVSQDGSGQFLSG